MNLTEEAQGLLPYQFSQSLKLHGLVESLVRPFQEIEQLIEKMHHGCYISKAYGAQLDTLGDIVGMKRMGMDDEHYRAWISVSIKLNLCSGTTEEIFEIIGIMLENQKDFLMHEYPTQTLVFTFFSKPKVPLQSFFQIIKSAVALGSEALFVHAQKNSFQFDVTPFSKSQFAEFFKETI